MTQRSASRPASPSRSASSALPGPWLALALVAAGLALPVILTHNYHRHLLAAQVSGCSISEYVDCDRVSESPYAAVAGVPISALAIAAYGALGVLLALPLLPPFRRLAGLNLDVAVILAAAGTLVALALAVVAALVIRALCIYCALLQVVTVALFLVLAWRWRQNRVRSGSRRQLRGVGQGVGSAVLALAVGAVPAGIATLGFESSALAAADRAVTAASLAEVSPYLSRDAFSFDTTDSPGVGPADALVQIVVFGDYNCSHCRQFDPEALQLAEDFPGDVRVVFKFFPLDATCNRFMGRQQVSSSCLAAAAAYAAHQHDHFLDYHLLLYEHFHNHAPQRLLANAEEAGIADPEAFIATIQNEETLRFIQRDIDEGARGGVQGTPTIFVNGRRLESGRLPEGATRYQVLVHEIRTLLRAAL